MLGDLQTSFYFTVKLSGDTADVDAAFAEVAGLQKELGVEEVVSGGENRFKYRLPTTVSYGNLILKRGVILVDSPLIEWCQLTLDSGLASPISTKNIMINLLNPQGKSAMSWSFVKAYPLKWSIGDLKAKDGEVLIETLEFAYQYFEAQDPRDSQDAGIANLFADS